MPASFRRSGLRLLPVTLQLFQNGQREKRGKGREKERDARAVSPKLFKMDPFSYPESEHQSQERKKGGGKKKKKGAKRLNKGSYEAYGKFSHNSQNLIFVICERPALIGEKKGKEKRERQRLIKRAA